MTYQAQGDEFLVNTVLSGSRGGAQVVGLETGAFLVLWSSEIRGIYSSKVETKAQLYDANGQPVGTEFTVNSYATGYQTNVVAAALPGGGFVASWHSDDGVTGSDDIKAQIFDGNGVKLGGVFTVNSPTPYEAYSPYQSGPEITALTGGGFVVTWSDSLQGYTAVNAQTFDGAGARVGDLLVVSQLSESVQKEAVVVALRDGGFVIVQTNINFASLEGHRYSAAGVKIGDAFDRRRSDHAGGHEPGRRGFRGCLVGKCQLLSLCGRNPAQGADFRRRWQQGRRTDIGRSSRTWHVLLDGGGRPALGRVRHHVGAPRGA